MNAEFNENGVIYPVQIFNKDEIDYYRSLLEYEIDYNNMINNQYRCKSILLYSWIDTIARNEKILSYVSDILGPNFFCWDTQCWLKEPNDRKYVSWHQDATYWNFKVKKGVIVWLAFDDVTEDMGPVIYRIKSHKFGQYRHIDNKSTNNLLTRGQTINDIHNNFDEVKLTIEKGCISMHDPYIVHCSNINTNNKRRLGYSLQYISTDCEPLLENSIEYATLVSGKDEYNFIKHSPQASGNFNKDLKHWKIAFGAQRGNYLRIQNEQK